MRYAGAEIRALKDAVADYPTHTEATPVAATGSKIPATHGRRKESVANPLSDNFKNSSMGMQWPSLEDVVKNIADITTISRHLSKIMLCCKFVEKRYYLITRTYSTDGSLNMIQSIHVKDE